jgi:hypothetical protein
MVVLACFGVPQSQACAQARRYLVLSHTAHFRNASICGAVLRTFQCIRSCLTLLAGLSGGTRGSGPKNSVRQPQCDWFAVPLPGVSPTVSSSFEQNLPSGPEEVVTKIEKVK